MLSGLATALIEHKRIRTTDAKAKETRKFIEPLITRARRGTLHDRRQILRKLHRPEVVKTLVDEIAPNYQDRPGGYTRIVKLGFRDNDNAPVSLLEFVDLIDLEDTSSKRESKAKKKTKKGTKKAESSQEENSRQESD